MHRGYIKLHRKAMDSGLIQHARAWQFLSWCLLSATHRPYKKMFNGMLFDLQPGQLVTSRQEACAWLCLTEKEYRSVVRLLEKANFLTSRGGSRGTVFSIVNWRIYQHDGQTGGQPEAGPGTGSGPAAIRTSTTKQEQRNKRIKNGPASGADADRSAGPSLLRPLPGPPEPAEASGDPEERFYRSKKGRKLAGRKLEWFERFWKAYAYPRGKAEAADAWLDIPDLGPDLLETILAGAVREAEARPRLEARGRMPKWPQGWLSARRWEDFQEERASPGQTAGPERQEQERRLFRELTEKWRQAARLMSGK